MNALTDDFGVETRTRSTEGLKNALGEAGAAARKVGAETGKLAADALATGKEAVSAAYDKGAATLSGAVEAGKNASAQVASQAAHFASDAAAIVKDELQQQKGAGADAIVALARSARESVDEMSNSAPHIAGAVKTVADKVEAVANDVKDKSLDDIVETLSDFARRKPMAFLGCGVLAGVVLSRLLASPRV